LVEVGHGQEDMDEELEHVDFDYIRRVGEEYNFNQVADGSATQK